MMGYKSMSVPDAEGSQKWQDGCVMNRSGMTVKISRRTARSQKLPNASSTIVVQLEVCK